MRTGCAALIILILVALVTGRPWRGHDPVVEYQPPRGDRITLVGGTASSSGYVGPETVVLVDADIGGSVGCRNDYLAPDPPAFDNLRLNTCGYSDEILVLSVDDAVTLDAASPGAGFWSDAVGEERAVALGARTVVPLVLHQMVPGDGAEVACVAGAATAPAGTGCDVRNLEYAFNLQRGGLAFEPVVRDHSTSPGALAAIGCASDGTNCLCPATAPADPALYDAKAIHVYLVGAIRGGASGRACETLPRGFVYLSKYRGPFTLAHELGHTFGLPHPDGTYEYDSPAGESLLDGVNLMLSGQSEEADVRLGQAMRMSVLPWSFVNTAGLRPGAPVRACEPDWAADYPASLQAHVDGASADGVCPRVSFR